MKIADLFVQLGVKGDGSVKSALKNTKDGLGEAKSMALETKAAILGVIYGLQQLMSKSAQAGSDLSQFASSTGLSAETLQRWQYAARQFNVGADEINASIKSVQDNMTNMLMGKGAPEGLGLLSNTVGFDPKKARDTFYVMQQLQKLAQQLPADVSKNIMKSFGLSEGVIAAMNRNAFNSKAFSKANIYSKDEAERLRKVDVGWENLGDKFGKMIGHLNGKYGLKLMEDIDLLTTKVLNLAEAFVVLAEKIKALALIGKSIEVIASGIENLTTAGTNLATLLGMLGNAASENPTVKKMVDSFKLPEGNNKLQIKGADEYWKKVPVFLPDKTKLDQGKRDSKGVEVNQNLIFQHDGKDPKKVMDSHKKASKDAYNQLAPQINGGN